MEGDFTMKPSNPSEKQTTGVREWWGNVKQGAESKVVPLALAITMAFGGVALEGCGVTPAVAQGNNQPGIEAPVDNGDDEQAPDISDTSARGECPVTNRRYEYTLDGQAALLEDVKAYYGDGFICQGYIGSSQYYVNVFRDNGQGVVVYDNFECSFILSSDGSVSVEK